MTLSRSPPSARASIFRMRSFGGSVSSGFLHDRAQVVADLARVLKYGGKLVPSRQNASYAMLADGRQSSPLHVFDYAQHEL